MYFFFFFSSRRRHTRLQGDWSSDVCSSDLLPGGLILLFFLFELGTDQLQDGEPGSVANPPASLDNSRIAARALGDRKSTRLNSSHLVISYAVFCLKKKNTHLR